MGNAVFRGMSAPRRLDRFSKKLAQLITSVTPPRHPTSKFWGQSVQRGRVWACVKLSPSGVYFLSFLGFMRIATGRPVGPIVAINDSNDASSWPSRSFYGFVNKENIFPIFTQKCEKLHYTLWELWTAITLASLKIRTSCLHQTGDFRGRAIEWCQTDPCCHSNQS